VARTCEGLITGEVADVVALLTSELVTNAVVHASSWADVELIWTDGSLLVEVTDGNAEKTVRRPERMPHNDETGRGLALVSALATVWGLREAPPRKTIWFTVPSLRQSGTD
jgi:anti-sigma regulatory factor (Ser/Thr protein kinase)